MYATQFTDQVVRRTALFGSPQELSDEVSDNRDRQRWTPADTHGRSVPGQACCGAGSLHLYLASGRRGRLRCRIGRRSLTSVHCIAELSLTGSRRRRCAAPLARRQRRGLRPWEAPPAAHAGPKPTRQTKSAHLTRRPADACSRSARYALLGAGRTCVIGVALAGRSSSGVSPSLRPG